KTPKWATGGPVVSITRPATELSIVCRGAVVPAGAHADRGWQCLRVEGPLPLSMGGVAAGFTAILARAGLPAFVISTFATDYVLTKGDRIEAATQALQAAGHSVQRA